MFFNIINSQEKHYSTTYYHSSDIPGDTTTNTYGYGSYTSSYKNSAAIYLTKIFIKKKQFQKAFKYLEEATSKYEVTYSCGTGYRQQKEEYDFLYACCYEGLNKPDKLLELLLPECLNRNDEIIIRAIKKTYSPKEIKEYLAKAESSLQCSFDTLPTFSFQTTYHSENNPEKTDTLVYYSGSATINLFDKTIDLPTPRLENDERVTKEHFIREFKETSFYINLSKVGERSQHTTKLSQKAKLK
jgi:hypothetical protein